MPGLVHGRWKPSAADQMPKEKTALPTQTRLVNAPRSRASAISVSMTAVPTANGPGAAVPTECHSSIHWWMTGVWILLALPSSSSRVWPWMKPGSHLNEASTAQTRP